MEELSRSVEVRVSGTGDFAGLSDAELDAVLDGLAGAVTKLIADTVAMEDELDAWSDEEERFIEQPRRRGDVRRAVVSLRQKVAISASCALRAAGRELVVWWADLATCAVLAAAKGGQVDAVRGAAAEPGRYMGAAELERLPAASEHDRLLAGLALRMSAAPMGSDGKDYDMPALARDVAERAGLMVWHAVDGEPTIVDDGSVEGRRRRLWGGLWVDYQLPELPDAAWLAEVLAAGGTSSVVVEDVRGPAAAVADVLTAARRLDELRSSEESEDSSEDSGAAAMDEFDALWESVESATKVLATYAETLTRHVPAIRVAAATRPAD